MELISHTMVTEDTAPAFPEVRVNDALISEQEIAAEMQYHPASSLETARQQAAQALVVRELLLQQARKQGIEAKPEGTESEEEALIRALLAQEVTLPEPDEQACRQYFASNRQRFRSPDLIAARHILLGADPNDAAERQQRKEQAEALIALLQQDPERFAALAKEHSDCPSKELGGNLGQLDKGQTVPEFERQVFALEVGLCPHPIESRYGFHVVRIEQRIDGEPLPYEQVSERIAHYLREQVYRRGVSQYISLLAAAAEITGVELNSADSLLVQ